MELLISGYGKKGNVNIVKCDETGNVTWSDTVEAPSFVIVSGNRMFTVTEIPTESYIHSYIKDGEGYKLIDSARFEGTDLCHICFSEKNMMVFGACWGSGHLLYATIDESGKFIKTASIYQEPENDDPEIKSRVHFVHVNKAEDTLLATNVGLDIIYFYSIKDGEITLKDKIYTEKGQHPRHVVYTKDESVLYVITELSNEVLVYKMPEKKLLQRISTLPAGFEGKSHCSAICLSPDEKTVYGANRYSESLIFFGVDEKGTLYERLRLPCDGEKPRHMELTADGKNLIVCYQVSGEVCIMPLDDSGLPVPGAQKKFPFHDAAGIAEL
ncbi:MAG: lactonase family protein [Ruminococcaceae bacterium]|nr:lactonase family protein [Oscillospiraceae bacterium]